MINPEIYERMLNDEGFLNDLWNGNDATTKIGILEKAGFDLEAEYKRYESQSEDYEDNKDQREATKADQFNAPSEGYPIHDR